MLIVCPNCSTSYDVDGGKLGAGRPVRCARCKTTWQATAVAEDPVAEGPVAKDLLAKDPVAKDLVTAEWEAALASDATPAPFADERKPRPGTAIATARPDDDGWDSAAAERATAVAVSPPLVPADDDASLLEGRQVGSSTDAERADIESAAARRMRPRKKNSRRSPSVARLPLFIIAMLGILALLVAARVPIVRLAPQSAGLYAAVGLPVNLRGLAIEDVKTTEDMQDNVPVLVVEGSIRNVAKHAVDVPRLRFAVRNTSGLEVYAWTALPAQPVLGAGERLAFRSRLASPPPDAQDIVVRFFNRRDLEAVR